MRRALDTLATGAGEKAATVAAIDAHHLARTLKELIAKADLVVVRPKQKVTDEQARAREKADGFKINGEIYVKPDRFKRWISVLSRNALCSRSKRLSSRSAKTRRPSRGR